MVGGRTATQPAQPGQPVPLKPGSPLNRDKVKQKNHFSLRAGNLDRCIAGEQKVVGSGHLDCLINFIWLLSTRRWRKLASNFRKLTQPKSVAKQVDWTIYQAPSEQKANIWRTDGVACERSWMGLGAHVMSQKKKWQHASFSEHKKRLP